MSTSSGALPILGFIGLGAMGGRMVKNLLRAGYAVHAFDLMPERLDECAQAGAVAAEDAEDAARQGEVVMTSLPSSESFIRAAETVLLPNAREGQVFIELGTTVPLEIRRLAGAFSAKGATLLDVPVSGWITGAESGTLMMFVGGDEAAFRRCLPILEVLGDPERITYCGPSGAGQVVKGVNQLKSGLLHAANLEAIAFGVRAGVDASILLQVFGHQKGDRLAANLKSVADGKGEEVGVKFRELPYYLEEAEAQGFRLPITETLHAVCDAGERVVIDDNRQAPSFWRELLK